LVNSWKKETDKIAKSKLEPEWLMINVDFEFIGKPTQKIPR